MRPKSYYKFLLSIDVKAKSQEKAIEFLQKKLAKKADIMKIDYLGKIIK